MISHTWNDFEKGAQGEIERTARSNRRRNAARSPFAFGAIGKVLGLTP
jgi:hypothetical protein